MAPAQARLGGACVLIDEARIHLIRLDVKAVRSVGGASPHPTPNLGWILDEMVPTTRPPGSLRR